jgi:DNA-binding NarL/FixJ family response regulator
MRIIKLIIADDHNILRQGLVGILKNYEDICIVAEAEDGNSLIRKYEMFKPDVVLTDIEMPELSGLAAAIEIIEKHPEAKILFLSMHYSDEYIIRIDEIGGMGLVSKEIIKDELVTAIRTVAEGNQYFMGKSPSELLHIKEQYNKLQKEENKATLTKREKEVLKFISEGLTSDQIGDKLHVGKRTIDFARTQIMRKLKIDSSHQLLIYAIENKEKFKFY